jgi:hypothetical protein
LWSVCEAAGDGAAESGKHLAAGHRVDEKGMLPDVERLAPRDRDIIILRDAIAITNQNVRHALRPVIINGIDEIASRGDLVSRSVVLTLPPIPDRGRTFSRMGSRAIRAAYVPDGTSAIRGSSR